MKLFIDCRMLNSGGIGTYLESLLPYFTEAYDCTLLIYSNQKNSLPKLPANTHIIETEIQTFSLKEMFFFPKSLRNIINLCDFFYSPYCNIPNGIKIPVFTTIHDIVFLDVPGLSSSLGTIVRKFFYQRAINKSKAIFTVSQFSADRIKEKLRLRKKPLIVTYNSVPEHFTANNNKPATGEITKDNSIIYVGNIKKHKGLPYLLDAFEICKKNGLDCKLVIVGNADNFRSGDSEIAQRLSNSSEKDINFTGRISDSELQTYYQKARLLVQPSLYEGFGMPPMEALYLGTNVVMSDIPVFKEIYEGFPVTFFKTADSKDLAEKIQEAFNKPAPAASAIPQKYSFKNTANIIINTFRSIK
ncbi:Glycosyltransferase involved in cell wall bisynthesis [Treponema bryantii]|uniref:Glycosyltransferase involved in cell wall bisynthesis n=1 Tax=Treponema bryantii TaxID=163 RepID=A0A1H9J331_9SPIR|nr:glycosyltransferase family 1 protein [Treponema bryantii]SEQ81149.1 Glycosyltransferase involved in cell wall bisynthesis [Treponema bryantii]